MNKEFKFLAKPYQLWLSIFVFVPILAMVFIGFSNLDSTVSLGEIALSFKHLSLFKESSTLIAFKNSLLYASLTTIISLVLGYFIAYEIKLSKFKNKFILLTIVILPI